MKAIQKSRRTRLKSQELPLEQRTADAYSRCQFVLKLFQEHTVDGARNLATMNLENAANHLELLARHPFFMPGYSKREAFQQDAANHEEGLALVEHLRSLGFWSRKSRR